MNDHERGYARFTAWSRELPLPRHPEHRELPRPDAGRQDDNDSDDPDEQLAG